jgi:diacylglycerol kinase (ATP)
MRMNRIIAAWLNSLRGLRWALRRETALRQEIIGLSIALPVAALISPDLSGFVMLIGVILAVIAAELLNTAVEKLSDHITPEHHPQIGIVKDLGSAAVFAMLMLAVLVWGAGIWRWWTG